MTVTRSARRRVGQLGTVGALMSAGVLLFSGVANADSFNYNLHWTPYTWGDCNIISASPRTPITEPTGARSVPSRSSAGRVTASRSSSSCSCSGAVLQPGYTSVGHWNHAYGYGNRILETAARCGTGS